MAPSLKPAKLSDLIDDPNSQKGSWELTPNHEVQFKSKDQTKEVSYKGSLVAAEPDALVLSMTAKESDTKLVTKIIKLQGTWCTNTKNQIQFEVEKESGKNDVLTFKAGWKVNDRHEIVYTYKTTKLKTKIKQVQELIFKGYWDISEKNRLTYLIGRDSNSAFRFRGAFQTKSILAKKGEIRYQVGVEVVGKHKIQTIALFGKWKLSRDLGLDFEIEYSSAKKAISFGGNYALNDSTQIAVNLKSQHGKSLGVEVIFTRDIFGKDGQAFVRLQKSLEESRIEAGVSFRL